MTIILYLRNLIKKKEEQEQETRQKMKDAKTADEVRALGDTLQKILDELKEARDMLSEEEKKEGGEQEQEREDVPEQAEQRGGNPLASFGMGNNVPGSKREDESGFASLEYRTAFKAFVQRGTKIPDEVMARAGGDPGTTVADDIGAIIPQTIMNEFIKEVSKVYGQIYSKVRKMNVRGGVKFPISKLKATFKWITETTISGKQKAGDIKEFVEFNYNIGEIRVAETLLAQVVSLELFEAEITRIMVEAYVEEMDKGIITGTGSGQLLGITKDPRVTKNTSNIIRMTAEEFADWTSWRKKLFAKVPLSKRGKGEFLFPSSTVESYLMTMKDKNDRPLFKEATDSNIGNTAGSFFGRTTDLVEPDVRQDFDTAAPGDVVGIFWVPSDYVINTNLQFGMKRWFDDNTNEWINKGLTIVDGKILDVSGCYLIKKAESAGSGSSSTEQSGTGKTD